MPIKTRAPRLHRDRGVSETLAHIVGGEEFKGALKGAPKEPGTSDTCHCLAHSIPIELVVQPVSQEAYDQGPKLGRLAGKQRRGNLREKPTSNGGIDR